MPRGSPAAVWVKPRCCCQQRAAPSHGVKHPGEEQGQSIVIWVARRKSHIANNHCLWFALSYGQRPEQTFPLLLHVQTVVPGYYCLADMDPITCSLAVQQQSEHRTVLTKPGDSRDLAQTAKGDHEAATQTSIIQYRVPQTQQQVKSQLEASLCQGPSHVFLSLLCLLRGDAAHCGSGHCLMPAFMGMW